MVAGVILLAVGTVCGCGKKQEARAVVTSASNGPPPAVAPGAAPAAQVVQPAVTLTQPDGQVDLPELQRSVLRWILANRRRPASFEEFAATSGLRIPAAPSGKKYVLTKDMHVQLVNR